jgi:alkylation response protein AidB-like acyl-CoA dehydrogenase
LPGVVSFAGADMREDLMHDHGAADGWLEPDEIAGLTGAALAERVRALAPFLASRAEAAERERRPDDDVMAALRRTGLYYHFVPKRFGGLELGVPEFVEEVLPMAEACASTAWVTSFCMEHNLILALFPEQAQEEIFGSQPYMIAPGAAFPVGRAVIVPGGYRVSGRWNYASGVMHADWAMAMVKVDRPDVLDVRWVIVPISEVEVHDVWRVDGMAGTGSNDMSMHDVFVPEHRTLDIAAAGRGEAPGASIYDNPLYAMPLTTFLALTAALPIVGAARGAQRLFLERVATRVSAGVKLADRVTVQAVLGEVTVAVDVAEMIVRGAAHDVIDLATTGRAGDIPARAAIRARLTHATTSCRDAVRRMLDTAGSSAHDLANPLQRIARDVAMGSAHVVHDPLTTTELYGRTLLGLPPQTPLV